MTEREAIAELLPLTPRELGAWFERGHAVTADAIAGAAYRGISLGVPAWVERMAWKKFQKVFYRDPERGIVRGWNVRLMQNGLTEPSVPKMRRGRPITFGHFVVRPVDASRAPLPSPGGVVIDYGLGGNGLTSPLRAVRDPLVSLSADDASLLLGYTYLELGLRTVATSSFFLLIREDGVADVVEPPRAPRGR